jgi:galactonate dehydratase
MNARRQKLHNWIALQAAAAAAAGTAGRDHPVSDLQAFPLREPGSGRRYTVVRVRTRTGITGVGECGPVTAADIEQARAALTGKPATSYQVVSTGTRLDGAIDMALIDITARACSAPVCRLLGGPTRTKARALARLHGDTDAALATSLEQGMRAGYRAFQVPLPPLTGRNQGQAFDKAVRARMDALRKAGGEDVDFVLDGASRLTAGDAGSVAASLERFHLLWFDEPCPVSNTQTLRKVSEETVTPLGFGRNVGEASVFQELLRQGCIDILRPDLASYGISRIRQAATLAETYYVAVAPNHEGGPVGTAAAIHLAAALPNFFIQHVPQPLTDAGRAMRQAIVAQPVEAVHDGFLAVPSGSGFGIELNEAALNQYREKAA